VRIELVPVAGVTGTAISTYSAPDGTFAFSNLSYGKYMLTATMGVIGTSQDVVVESSQDWVSVAIDVDAASKDATVSVAELKVPSKARKELEKARQALSHNKLVDADRYIAKALLAWPHYCQALTLRATLALARNSYEPARADAEQAVEYDPTDSSAYIVLGDAYILLNRLDDAQRAVDRSIEIKPNAWEGYYDRGRISVIRHDWPGALRQAAKAASLKTEDDPYLHLLKALAFAGMNDQAAAKNEVNEFRRLKPESSWSPQTKRRLREIGMPAIGNSGQPILSGSHAN
jgi:tetratricopeptide (TPR) repeat protein